MQASLAFAARKVENLGLNSSPFGEITGITGIMHFVQKLKRVRELFPNFNP
jgi:hypothetical protein